MIVLGAGMGFVFQVYLVAMQNSISPKQMGIATATTQFFRSMGATFGVAVFGTILINRFLSELMTRLGPIARNLKPSEILNAPVTARIPPAIANDVKQSLAISLHEVFVAGIVVVAIAAAISFLLKEMPLRTTSNMSDALSSELGQAGEGAPEVAEPAVGR
jgi:hypothetical protein